MAVPPVDEAALPALFRAADQRSQRAQLTHRRLVLGQLAALVLTATLDYLRGVWGVPGLGLAAVAGAALVIFLRVLQRSWQSEKTWYQARAAAESLKTLSWKYMMRAAPFPGDEPDGDRLFLSRMRDLLADLSVGVVVPTRGGADQITPVMRSVRRLDLAGRRRVYEADRIINQSDWYTTRAILNERLAHRWETVMLILIFGELGRLPGHPADRVDAGDGHHRVSVVATWVGVRRYDDNAAAYSVAAHELGAIKS